MQGFLCLITIGCINPSMLRGNNIGAMDVRLVIQKNTPTVNATTNEREAGWSDLTTVWAERLTKGGKEGFEADQEVAINREHFRFRHTSLVSSIDATHRVHEKDTTDYFYVTVVEKQKRQDWIMIQAEKRDNG